MRLRVILRPIQDIRGRLLRVIVTYIVIDRASIDHSINASFHEQLVHVRSLALETRPPEDFAELIHLVSLPQFGARVENLLVAVAEIMGQGKVAVGHNEF